MSYPYRALLIFGAPGSGKGTQGKVLGQLPGFFHCACGDVFRALDKDSELGKKSAEYASKGQLVPDELTVDLWKNQIQSWIKQGDYNPETEILILDGIPRNVEQAKIMQDLVDVLGIIHLSCPNRDELVERMSKRAIRENRMDDADPKVIWHRIKTYEAETRPILDFYSSDKVLDIIATQAPLKVLADITSATYNLLNK